MFIPRLKYFRWALLSLIWIVNFNLLSVEANPISDTVVKIFVTPNKIDYYRPWQSTGISASSGTGVILEGGKILTNAHVIADQTFIQVKKDNDSKKYTAKVLAVGNDCDLAILTVEDKEFFKGINPIKFGQLPNLQDKVVVLGYPQGGEKISITEGIVSRIDITPYTQSSKQLLSVQIDAAINPGNSGGPVVQNGQLIGIAMQYLQSGQNIGYIIPTPVIEHFFKDLDDGHYDGFPVMGIDFNISSNKSLRKYFKIEKVAGGVVVSKVLPFTPAFNIIKEGDVLLNIDDIPIAEDGTFQFRDADRLTLTYLITKRQMGEAINLKVIRDGVAKDLSVKLSSFAMIVPPPEYFDYPSYYIYGGAVFTILSTDLLASYGGRWWETAPLDFTYYLAGTGRMNKEERKEIVVMLDILPDDINVGYHDYDNEIITKVNGEEFKSFKQFVQLLQKVKNQEKFTVIETEHNLKIILENQDIDKKNQEIIMRNNIPQQYSKDVAEWLKEGK